MSPRELGAADAYSIWGIPAIPIAQVVAGTTAPESCSIVVKLAQSIPTGIQVPYMVPMGTARVRGGWKGG